MSFKKSPAMRRTSRTSRGSGCVEDRGRVHVKFTIPCNAASHLQHLVDTGWQGFEDLGVLSVRIENNEPVMVCSKTHANNVPTLLECQSLHGPAANGTAAVGKLDQETLSDAQNNLKSPVFDSCLVSNGPKLASSSCNMSQVSHAALPNAVNQKIRHVVTHGSHNLNHASESVNGMPANMTKWQSTPSVDPGRIPQTVNFTRANGVLPATHTAPLTSSASRTGSMVLPQQAMSEMNPSIVNLLQLDASATMSKVAACLQHAIDLPPPSSPFVPKRRRRRKLRSADCFAESAEMQAPSKRHESDLETGALAVSDYVNGVSASKVMNCVSTEQQCFNGRYIRPSNPVSSCLQQIGGNLYHANVRPRFVCASSENSEFKSHAMAAQPRHDMAPPSFSTYSGYRMVNAAESSSTNFMLQNAGLPFSGFLMRPNGTAQNPRSSVTVCSSTQQIVSRTYTESIRAQSNTTCFSNCSLPYLTPVPGFSMAAVQSSLPFELKKSSEMWPGHSWSSFGLPGSCSSTSSHPSRSSSNNVSPTATSCASTVTTALPVHEDLCPKWRTPISDGADRFSESAVVNAGINGNGDLKNFVPADRLEYKRNRSPLTTGTDLVPFQIPKYTVASANVSVNCSLNGMQQLQHHNLLNGAILQNHSVGGHFRGQPDAFRSHETLLNGHASSVIMPDGSSKLNSTTAAMYENSERTSESSPSKCLSLPDKLCMPAGVKDLAPCTSVVNGSSFIVDIDHSDSVLLKRHIVPDGCLTLGAPVVKKPCSLDGQISS